MTDKYDCVPLGKQLLSLCIEKRADVVIIPVALYQQWGLYVDKLIGPDVTKKNELFLLQDGVREVAPVRPSTLLPEHLAILAGNGGIHIVRLREKSIRER